MLGDRGLVDFVVGWRDTAYQRLRREGLEREDAVAGANAEAMKWVEEFLAGTFSHIDDRRIRPTRVYFPPFRPPDKTYQQDRLAL